MRIDFVFSYWIFVWYILYISRLTNINPKFALNFAFIHNIIILLFMIYYGRTVKSVLLFMMMILLLKIIPIYTLYNTSIKRLDIITTFILLLIYICWLFINGETIDSLSKMFSNFLKNENFLSPGVSFLNNILKIFID